VSADDVPSDTSLVSSFYLRELNGIYDPRLSYTVLDVFANGGAVDNQAYQVRLSYDWTSDGQWDRYETWGIFRLDDDAQSWESYRDQMLVPFLVQGSDYEDFVDGTLRIEFWQVFNRGSPISILTGGPDSDAKYSRVILPYDSTSEQALASSTATAATAIPVWAIVVVAVGATLLVLVLLGLIYRVFIKRSSSYSSNNANESPSSMQFHEEDPAAVKQRELEMEEQAAVERIKQKQRQRQEDDEEQQE
jgi:hypothetical protein